MRHKSSKSSSSGDAAEELAIHARRTVFAAFENPSNGHYRGPVLRPKEMFQCPVVDRHMKKHLIRLANETANHLIKDTTEDCTPGSNGAHSLQWRHLHTINGIEIFRGHEHEPHRQTSCLRGIGQVNASIEEFAMLFKMDSHKEMTASDSCAEHGLLFNPDLLEMLTLYGLVQPSGEHPRRYVGIKWCLVQSPSKLLFRNRDFCFLECQKEFTDARGRRGWVRSLHSIKMPCCPSLETSHGIVRASLYRCGLIAVESDTQPGVLETTYTIELDLKGHFPELFQPSFLAHRIAALASIDRILQRQRLSYGPLLGDLEIPVNTQSKAACCFCYRSFASSFLTKRFVCRKCGECVCKYCSDDWDLDIPVIGSKRVRICTVCAADARFPHPSSPHPVIKPVRPEVQRQQKPRSVPQRPSNITKHRQRLSADFRREWTHKQTIDTDNENKRVTSSLSPANDSPAQENTGKDDGCGAIALASSDMLEYAEGANGEWIPTRRGGLMAFTKARDQDHSARPTLSSDCCDGNRMNASSAPSSSLLHLKANLIPQDGGPLSNTTIEVSVNVDDVIPILLERFSQQKLMLTDICHSATSSQDKIYDRMLQRRERDPHVAGHGA